MNKLSDYVLLTPRKKELVKACSPSLIADFGINIDQDRVFFKPIKDHSVLRKTRSIIHDFGSGRSREIATDTDVLHLGSITGISNSGASYNNYDQLRARGIWGNPDNWTYVGTKIVSCGSGHMDERILLYIDKKELFRTRDVYFDPEGLEFPSEFGKTFRFKGGIPMKSINLIEFFLQRKPLDPDFTKVLKTRTIAEFLAN